MNVHDRRDPVVPRLSHRRSRGEIMAMWAVMIAGAVGLTQLSIAVTSPSPEVLAARVLL